MLLYLFLLFITVYFDHFNVYCFAFKFGWESQAVIWAKGNLI